MPPPWPPSVKAGRRITGKREVLRELVGRRDDRDSGTRRPTDSHRLAEELAVLGARGSRRAARRSARSRARRARPSSASSRGEVERGLAAERRQQRVRALARENVGDALEVERLEVRAVGEARVGHDRRRVRVDDDRPEPLLAQHLERLAPRVVELAGLPDHDRPGADQADRVEVRPLRQASPPPPSPRAAARRRAGPGPPPDGTGPTRALAGEREALDRAVVERDMGDLAAVALDREAVVLARDEHLVRPDLEHRVVRAAMAERQLEVGWPAARARSWCPRQMPSTGARPSSSRTSAIWLVRAAGSPGPFESRIPSGTGLEHCPRVDLVREDGHASARGDEPVQDRPLDAEVEHCHMEDPLPESIRLRGGDTGDERAALHRILGVAPGRAPRRAEASPATTAARIDPRSPEMEDDAARVHLLERDDPAAGRQLVHCSPPAWRMSTARACTRVDSERSSATP